MAVKLNMIWKNSMVYGAYTALAIILFTLLLYFTHTINSGWSIFEYALLIAGLTIGTKNYRDKMLGGYISYSNALGSGILISIFAGFILGFFIYILYSYDPQLLLDQVTELEDRLLERGMDPDKVEMLTAGTREALTPVKSVISGMFGYFLLGSAISLFMAIFVKKEASPFDMPSDNTKSNQQHFSE
jgi:hypothetical protein